MVLAVGVISLKPYCSLRFGDSQLPSLEWRCVIAKGYATNGGERILQTPCPNANPNHPAWTKQHSCACKFAHWTRFAYYDMPTAKFIAKVEDDSIINYSGLWTQIQTFSHLPMIWMGMFQWAYHTDEGMGGYCGEGDALLNKSPTHCGTNAGSGGVIAPFASGGFDLKSRDLIQSLVDCPLYFDIRVGSCDGGQGYRLVRCLSRESKINIIHFGWRKFTHHPTEKTIVLHNQKHSRPVKWNYTDPVPALRMTAEIANASRSQWQILDWRKK